MDVLHVDCGSCVARGPAACGDCVISVLLGWLLLAAYVVYAC